MVKENERWGYARIMMGALKNLGHEIGRNTIKRISLENGVDPAPERGKRMSWALPSNWWLDDDTNTILRRFKGIIAVIANYWAKQGRSQAP